MEKDIEKEVLLSRKEANKLLLSDSSSSSSFSMDRPSELAALLDLDDGSELGGSNPNRHSEDSDDLSSDRGNRPQILYRNQATKEIVETFHGDVNPSVPVRGSEGRTAQRGLMNFLTFN